MSEEVCNERIDWRAVAGVRRARGQRGVARFRQARPSARGCELSRNAKRSCSRCVRRSTIRSRGAARSRMRNSTPRSGREAPNCGVRASAREASEVSRVRSRRLSRHSHLCRGIRQEASPSAKPSWPNCAPNVMRWLRCKRRSGRPRPELRPSPVMTRLVPVIHVDPRSAAGRFVASARLGSSSHISAQGCTLRRGWPGQDFYGGGRGV